MNSPKRAHLRCAKGGTGLATSDTGQPRWWSPPHSKPSGIGRKVCPAGATSTTRYIEQYHRAMQLSWRKASQGRTFVPIRTGANPSRRYPLARVLEVLRCCVPPEAPNPTLPTGVWCPCRGFPMRSTVVTRRGK